MAFVEVDPISRIEGHLGVKLDVSDVSGGVVNEANTHGNLWRGFENFLIGREPNDAITFTQRICGVCPVPHGMTSTYAIDSVLGYSTGHITFSDVDADGKGVPAKAVHVRNMVLGAEFLMSHMTHFYHLAAPSYVQGPNMAPWTPYFDNGYYHPLLRSNGAALPGGAGGALWDAVIVQYVKALRMRRLTFEAGALFAGRMPMTSALVSGGVTTQDSSVFFVEKCKKFYNILVEVGKFIVKEHVPLVLALGALYPAYDNAGNAATAHSVGLDFGITPSGDVFDSGTAGIGAGLGNFLAWGGFPDPVTNNLALAGGYKLSGMALPSLFCTGKSDVAGAITAVGANLVEDTARSRYVAATDWGYNGTDSWAKPSAITRTEPDRDDVNKYSWLKAPRWKHTDDKYYAMEVGPFARMVVKGFYKVDGTALASSFNAAGLHGYAAYVADSTTALDKRCVDAGLATVLAGLGLAGVDGNGDYTGIIFAWVSTLKGGLSIMDRLRGRALEALVLVQMLIGGYSKVTNTFGTVGTVEGITNVPTAGWVGAAAAVAGGASYISKPVPLTTKSGYGATEAPRGALAHFVTIASGKISAYQCVVPTTWNASPKDGMGALRGDALNGRGAMEQAMVGSPYLGGATPGVEALRVAQSFDPCIACAVH